MRTISRLALASAIGGTVLLGLVATTPVSAWCGPGWPHHCKQATAEPQGIPETAAAAFASARLLYGLIF
jgi:hypothetical protein